MKIVLVYPNRTDLDGLLNYTPFSLASTPKKSTQPLGMLYLVSNLTHPVSFIDNTTRELSDDKLLEAIYAENHERNITGTMMILDKYRDEYQNNRKALANLFLRIGNLQLHVGRMRSVRRSLLKALWNNPREWRAVVRFILSLPGYGFYGWLVRWKKRKREW